MEVRTKGIVPDHREQEETGALVHIIVAVVYKHDANNDNIKY